MGCIVFQVNKSSSTSLKDIQLLHEARELHTKVPFGVTYRLKRSPQVSRDQAQHAHQDQVTIPPSYAGTTFPTLPSHYQGTLPQQLANMVASKGAATNNNIASD